MAFCTFCGAQVDDTAPVCPRCDKPLAGAPAAPRADGGALRALLIVLAVVIGVVIVSIAISGYVGLRVVRHAKVMTTPSGVKITSPQANVETTRDVAQFAQQSGVEIYPGATMAKEAANIQTPNEITIAANLESADPPDKVADFYKSKYPEAITHDEGGEHSIVSSGPHGTVTVHISPSAQGKTRIEIARVSRKSAQ